MHLTCEAARAAAEALGTYLPTINNNYSLYRA